MQEVHTAAALPALEDLQQHRVLGVLNYTRTPRISVPAGSLAGFPDPNVVRAGGFG